MAENVLELKPGTFYSGTLVGRRQQDDGCHYQRQDHHDDKEGYEDAPPVPLVRVAGDQLLKQWDTIEFLDEEEE